MAGKLDLISRIIVRDGYSNALKKFEQDASRTGKRAGSSIGAGAAIGASAFAYAATQALQALTAFGTQAAIAGAQLSDLESAYNSLAGTHGFTTNALLDSMNAVSKGNLSAADTFKNLNFAMQSMGPSLARAAPQLYEMARAAALATGDIRNLEHIYSTLQMGIVRGSPRLIDNANIFIKAGEANEKYAASLGITVEKMTDQQKQMATLTAVLDDYARITELNKDVVESETEVINRLKKAWEDRLALIGETIIQYKIYRKLVEGGTRALSVDSDEEGYKRVRLLIDWLGEGVRDLQGQRMDIPGLEQTIIDLKRLQAQFDGNKIAYDEYSAASLKLLQTIPIGVNEEFNKELSKTRILLQEDAREADNLADSLEKMSAKQAATIRAQGMAEYRIPGFTNINEEMDKIIYGVRNKVLDMENILKHRPVLREWWAKEIRAISDSDLSAVAKRLKFDEAKLELEEQLILAGGSAADVIEDQLADAISSGMSRISSLIQRSDLALDDKLQIYPILAAQYEQFLRHVQGLDPGIAGILSGAMFGQYEELLGLGGRSTQTSKGGPIDGLIDSMGDLESMIESVIEKSTTVTKEDMIFTQLGRYAESSFEQVRRLNDVMKLGFDSPNFAKVAHLFSDAALANADLLKIEAKRLGEDIKLGLLPDEINFDLLATEFEAALDREAAKIAGMDNMINELSKRGALTGSLAQRKKRFYDMMGISEPEVTMQSLFDTVDQAAGKSNMVDKLLAKAEKDAEKDKEKAMGVGEILGMYLGDGVMGRFMGDDFYSVLVSFFEGAARDALGARNNTYQGAGHGAYEEFP